MTRCVKCASSLVDVEYVWPTDPSVDYKCRSCEHQFNSTEKPHSERVALIIQGAELHRQIHNIKIATEAQTHRLGVLLRELGEFVIKLQEFDKFLVEKER